MWRTSTKTHIDDKKYLLINHARSTTRSRQDKTRQDKRGGREAGVINGADTAEKGDVVVLVRDAVSRATRRDQERCHKSAAAAAAVSSRARVTSTSKKTKISLATAERPSLLPSPFACSYKTEGAVTLVTCCDSTGRRCLRRPDCTKRLPVGRHATPPHQRQPPTLTDMPTGSDTHANERTQRQDESTRARARSAANTRRTRQQ